MPLLIAALSALFALAAAAQEDSVAAPDTKGGAPMEWERATLVIVSSDSLPQDKMVALYGGLKAAGLVTVEPEDRAGVDLPLAPNLFAPTHVDGIRAELVAARAAMRQLEMETVVVHLQKAFALGGLLQSPQAYAGIYVEMLLLRAQAALATGDENTALSDLRLAQRLQPQVEGLDPGLHSPTLVDRYAQAKAENAKAEMAFMSVQERKMTGPKEENLEVFVDGKRVETPESFTLSSGPHLLSFTRPARDGRRVDRTRMISPQPGTTTVLNVFLPLVGADRLRATAMAKLQADALGPAGEKARRQVLNLSGAQAAVILDREKGALYLSDGRLMIIPQLPDDPLAFGRAVALGLEDATKPPPQKTESGNGDLESNGDQPEGGDKGQNGTDESEGIGALWIGLGVTAGIVVIGGVATALTLIFWPEEEPDPPKDRTANVTCCVTGGT
jgi:hypothetical protein